MQYVFTHHGQARKQQRAVSELAIHLLLTVGKEEKTGNCWRYSFDKKAKKKLKKYAGCIELNDISKLTKTYIIVSESGSIVTCGYRM